MAKQPSHSDIPYWKFIGGSLFGIGLFALFLFIPIFVWYFCRIELGPDEIAVLIKKTGEPLPPGEIIAPSEKYKGIQLDVLPEGRYFRNPYTWEWKIFRVIDIPAGKLGVQTRLYGKDLPFGEIIARDGTKGIMPDILGPGKHRINPYAYHVQLFDAINIRPGHVGVVVSLVGMDIFNAELPEEKKNVFIVDKEAKGVNAEVLDPGTYYLNPFMFNITEVSLQSQRFEMRGADVIEFLTVDGFTVTVEGTIEFSLTREKVALLTHQVGDINEIVEKIILPRARGFSRLEGSKHPAIDFIIGETRQRFQDNLESHLRSQCIEWGINIKSVLIRKIIVPDEIASIIREREVAVQEAKKFEQQIIQAQSKAELVKQEMLALQNKEKVDAETKRIRAVIEAKQEQEVAITNAKKELEVALLRLEAAKYTAQSIEFKAIGERDAIRAQNEAELSVLQQKVASFGGGWGWACYLFYEKIAPNIQTLLTSDSPDGLGALFTTFLATKKGSSSSSNQESYKK